MLQIETISLVLDLVLSSRIFVDPFKLARILAKLDQHFDKTEKMISEIKFMLSML